MYSNMTEIESHCVYQVWDVLKVMPKSDLYVMEAPMTVLRSTGADANNPKSVHVNLQKAQLIAVLNTAINITRNMNGYFCDDFYVCFNDFYLYCFCFEGIWIIMMNSTIKSYISDQRYRQGEF